jgi:hypothetical protein
VMVGGKNVVVVKGVMDLGSRIGDGCVQGRSCGKRDDRLALKH